MFLAARYLNTYPDWDSAVNVLERLEAADVQTFPQDGRNEQIIFLDAMIASGPEPAPCVFILLVVDDGIALYLASGQHLSSTLDGAQKAFSQTYLEVALQGDSEEYPVTCRVFEFHYRGISHVLH